MSQVMRGSRLDGEIALVTGSGRGIGRALARGLAAQGAHLAVADSDGDSALETARLVTKDGGSALAITADVATTEGVQLMFDQIAAKLGTLSILVNNAGVLVQSSLVDHSIEDWNRQISVNARGVFLCLQAAARVMIPARRGSIVNLASTSAFVSSSTPKVGYDTTKGMVRTMTVSAAAELAVHGIRVNAIAPGTIQTEMSRPHWDTADATYRTNYLKRIPLGRLGAPDDLVEPVLFLASSDSQYVTGHVLVVDGGWLTL
jgi:NAD(P)-dependent dehydrogenase (short-subunit alcohol dehydrogenase family)